MTQINELKIMNDTMIVYLKKIGMNCKRNEIISNILKDEACFFKLEKEDACIILQDIGIDTEHIEETYSKLTSSSTFYDLLNNKKINENDTELKIKYKTYEADDLFKKKSVQNEENANGETALAENKRENIFKKIIRNIKRILHIS